MVEGVDEVNRAVHDLLSTTGAELLNLDRQPFARASSPYSLQNAVIEMLGRGVDVRTIYAGDAFRVAGYASYMRQAARTGERARLLAHLPVRFVVSDRGAAILPLAAHGPWVSAALVARGPVLVSDLVGLFDEAWERASVIDDADGAAATIAEPEFTDDEVALLRMLANDLTEGAIGRHLGASARTVGRRLALLQHKLGARTRFGLGAEAARRGLV